MRIAILSLGSRGDIQPALALAQTLASRGHEVRFVSHSRFKRLAAGRGVTFLPLGHMEGKFADLVGKDFFTRGLNPARMLRSFAAVGNYFSLDWSRQFQEFARGSDCVIGATFASFAAERIGAHCSIPSASAFFQPVFPTRAFPSAFLPALPFALPGFANLLTHHVFNQMTWMLFRPWIAGSLREVWRVKSLPVRHPIKASGDPDRPTLFAYSRHVVPRPTDWDASAAVTGYWFLDRLPAWKPPQDLVRFIEAGPPPVYVGFGSMRPRDLQTTTALVLDAIAKIGARAVVSCGRDDLAFAQPRPGAMAIHDVPHDWLFPRMAAIVHHGGAGTTAAALRAGKPSVVVPFLGDQAFWARRLFELGVAPAPLAYRSLNAERLELAVGRSLTDDGMRKAAAQLGTLIQSENGVEQAADIVEGLFRRTKNGV